MSTITKQELADKIAQSTHTEIGTVKAVMQGLFDHITQELAKDNRLEFRGFGVFEPGVRKARVAVNPRTMEGLQVPAKRMVRFKMGRKMKMMMDEIPAQSALSDDGIC